MTYPKLTATELAAIAPVKNGKPDLYNHMPTRFIPKAEAEERGWTWFYIGDVCSHGHKAPRYTSQPRQCVDCRRADNLLPPIGGKGQAEYTKRSKPYAQPAVAGTAVVPTQAEPSEIEKRFLVEYAKTKDFDTAAYNIKSDPAVFRARLSWSKVFSDAIDKLEADIGCSRTLRLDEEFDWTEEKRRLLIRVYIDTGDLGLARQAIGLSNYHFQVELQSNADFAQSLAEAEPLANRMLDEDAVRRARQGSDKLLDRVLTANLPEKYGAKVRVDMNITEKLTSEQLNSRFAQICLQFAELGGEKYLPKIDVLDAEFSEVASEGATEGDGDDGGGGSPPDPESNLDLL